MTLSRPSSDVVLELLENYKRMNYVSNWFSLDLLSCLPYDLLNYVITGRGDRK